ncbi:MAG: protein kinase, partial [Deltaproteobacteria bacterium]|nr:protein kinase [Deltaproteobacteria bacterium]
IVAVKTVRDKWRTEGSQRFFEKEARAAAGLDHPHIVRIFSFNPGHEPPYYVMQFVEGKPLDEACEGRNVTHVAETVERIAAALAYAHSHGLVHRDIKPSNILVDHEGMPHIADFGLAKRWGDLQELDLTETSRLAGTPSYIPPEIYSGEGQSKPSVDVYALGVTLYQLLTHRLPFTGKDFEELEQNVLEAKPTLPQDIDSSIPEPLQRICLKAMERDPSARYESAQLMAEDLRRFREGREVLARPTRYRDELRGRLHGHVTEIKLWHEQNLIALPEMDRLTRPYQAMLDAESPWTKLSRRFPWETIVVRLGGWLVLMACLLWPAYYWGKLDRLDRVLAVGFPTIVLNFAGWLSRRRGSKVNAQIFLSTGALLLPLFLVVCLSEYEFLQFPQGESYELFGEWAVKQAAEGGTDPPGHLAATNFQLTGAASAFVGYCILLVLVIRARLFAVWTGLGVYFAYTGFLLLGGLRRWVEAETLARVLLCYLPICVSFWILAMSLERRSHSRGAGAFYTFFPVPLAVILTLLAIYGSKDWLSAKMEWDNQTIHFWLIGNGLLYLAVGLRSRHARASFVRLWGWFFILLVPLSLLLPTNILTSAGKGYVIAEIGGKNFTTYELATAFIALAFVVMGTKLDWQVFTVPGLTGVVVFTFRATQWHFRDSLSWPLALAVT